MGAVTEFLIKDHLASNRVVTRLGDPTPDSFNFGPYGQPFGVADRQGNGGAKSYINQHYDPETGLQYLHARYLDGLLGRFITGDTWDVTIAGVDVNRCAYSANDPVDFSDANGHSAGWAGSKKENAGRCRLALCGHGSASSQPH